MSNNHSIDSLLKQASKQLSQVSTINQPQLEAQLLLSWVLESSREFVYAYPEKIINIEQVKNYQQAVARRCNGEPIAYITSRKAFWDLELSVNQHVLIPRPETELIIEIILELFPLIKAKSECSVLDLGTGSGAIALALAREYPDWSICGLDKSEEALKIAKCNAKQYQLNNIEFIHSSWFENIDIRPEFTFDIIASNPPYIAEHDPHLITGDLRYEPIQALASGPKGLTDIQKIIGEAQLFLKPGGLLILEHGYDQGEQVRKLLAQNNYQHITTRQDLANLDRVSFGWR